MVAMGRARSYVDPPYGGHALTKTHRYDYAFDPQGSAWAARLLRRVPLCGSVLELGPGPGAMTKVLCGRGHPVVVIEADPNAIASLEPLGVEVLTQDLNQSGWSEDLLGRRFETILACDVLEHLIHPDDVLEKLHQHICPEGRLIISVPNIAYAGVLAGLRCGRFDYVDKGQLDRTHIRFFTKHTLQNMLLQTGWLAVDWEAHRVTPEQSELSGFWDAIPIQLRQQLLEGWNDFDVYQWMVEAVPATNAGWAAALQKQLVQSQQTIHEVVSKYAKLQLIHDSEHASLLEHQKAFSEAKGIIDQLQLQLDIQQAELSKAHSDLAEQRLNLQQVAQKDESLFCKLKRYLVREIS